MKKMPCLFVRDFSDKRNPKITPEVTPGCEWVIAGEGVATRKFDGTACLVRDCKLYKRYDAKKGKEPPAGFEAADEPDAVTGHWPGWVPVNVANPDPGDVWHALAWWQAHAGHPLTYADGTYELVGSRINSNREQVSGYRLIRHGYVEVEGAERTFGGLRAFLSAADIEGIVFWRDLEDQNCDKVKIRREDFGFPWPRST